MAAKDELGRQGEEVAAQFLQQQGLTVISRNWRCREGELDIIATDGAALAVICEVKTRAGTGFGSGAEAVTQGKRRRIRRLSGLWLAEHRVRFDIVVRFDVISVLWLPGAQPQITHFPAAF